MDTETELYTRLEMPDYIKGLTAPAPPVLPQVPVATKIFNTLPNSEASQAQNPDPNQSTDYVTNKPSR